MDPNSSLRQAVKVASYQSAYEFMTEHDVSESDIRAISNHYEMAFADAASCIQIGSKLQDVKAKQLADLVLIYFTKEELHPDEAQETKDEMLTLAREIENGSQG